MGHDPQGSVLLIDDTAPARSTVAQWLSAEGFQVFEAGTRRSVVDRVATFHPHVVVCDLPDEDQQAVIDALRDHEAVPVIVRSDDGELDAVLRTVRCGAFDHVLRADGRDALLVSVERAVRHARLLRENGRLARELQSANEALGARLVELQRQSRRRAMVEDALILARDHAMSASQAKSAFLTNMSHELRTPLNAMLGYAELMTETVDDEGVVADLGRIVFAGHHLLGLIDDVLDLAKVEAGHVSVDWSEVDIDTICEAVRIQALPSVHRRGLTFEVDTGEGDAGAVWVDRRLFLQCLHQLVDNAVKFTDKGRVVLRVRRDDDEVRFSVIDTGRGISAPQQAAIFDVFSQGDSPGLAPAGPGLGLTIAQRLCDLMAATLCLESEVGRGSTFTITLSAHEPAGLADAPRTW